MELTKSHPISRGRGPHTAGYPVREDQSGGITTRRPQASAANVSCGSMLSKKGFCDERRATSIQNQMQMRNLDSKIRPPGFDRFKF
jgi:hypothetical protein